MAWLLAAALLAGMAWAADPAAQSCPLSAKRYKAKPAQTQLSARVDEPVALSFSLDPPEPPVGFFVTVNMTALDAPQAAQTHPPEILTGFPKTTAVFHAPGAYRYRVVVSLIAKSSCGGVKADTVFKGEVRIDVKP